MRFTLEIQLGNDAVQTSADIAEILRRVSSQVSIADETDTIRDINGNTVGRWTFVEETN